MKKLLSLLLALALGCTFSWAQESKSKELERVNAATNVLNEIMAASDKGIPEEILGGAECVVVVPSMIKGAFVFGGRYGRGIATCRTTSGNHWSAPAPLTITGGSWGLQFGGQAIDLVMLAMNKDGVERLLASKFKVGADASAAAGPVGRHVSAGTDWKMRAQLLTYSRARGLFAGISLDGAVVKQDTDDTLALYGNKYVNFRQILTGKVPPPAGTQDFIATVHKYFGEAKAASAEKREVKDEKKEARAEQRAADDKAAESASNTTAQAGGMSGAAGSTDNATSKSSQDSSGIASPQKDSSRPDTTTATTETNNTDQSSGAAASPDQIRNNIQNALHNTPNLASSNVNVDVNDSQVMLSGSVPSQADKATARRLAQQNAGGRQVTDDNLVVK